MTLEEYKQSFWGDVGGTLKQVPGTAVDVGQIATGGMARLADRMTGGAFPAIGNYGQRALQKRDEYEGLVTSSQDISPNVSGLFSAGMDVGKAATEQLAMSGAANLAGRAIQGARAGTEAYRGGRAIAQGPEAYNKAQYALKLAQAGGNPAKIKAAQEVVKAFEGSGRALMTVQAAKPVGQAFRAGAAVAPQFGTKATLLGGAARMIPPAVDAFGVDGGEYAQRVATVGGGAGQAAVGGVEQPAAGPVSATVDQVLAGQGAGQQQQPGFQYDYEDAMSKLGDVAAGGGRVVAPEAQRGVFVGGQKWQPGDKVYTQEEYDVLSEAGERPTREGGLDPLVATQGERGIRPGGFAERTTPDGGAYVIGSEADPMRRLEMQRDQYRAANRERYHDIASEMRTAGAQPQMTAIQIGDKREMDRRMASINAMPEGPAKQDALARVQDEATAKQAAGVKDSDRFTGSIGSPDHKAREGRMAAYQAKLKELSDSRLITKQQAGAAMVQARKTAAEDLKLENTMRTLAQKEEDKQVEAELMQRGLTEKKSIAAANSGFRSMATFNGKIGGKGPRINGAEVTDMFGQMDPAMRMDVMEEAARNVEHYEMDPRAAFMAAFTPFLKMKQRQTS